MSDAQHNDHCVFTFDGLLWQIDFIMRPVIHARSGRELLILDMGALEGESYCGCSYEPVNERYAGNLA